MKPTTERWFHGSISGVVAERLIREKGVNGSFLVRESQSKRGDYVLTVRTKDEPSQADKVTHIMIRHHNNKYDVGGGEKFNSLTELVEHYKRNPMVETTGTVVNMKYPFNATSFTALDIDARVNELLKKNPHMNGKEGFWEEFEHIQHQECKVLFNRKIGQEDRNMLKNRYKMILPYDYTRVILKKPISSRHNNENHHRQQQYLTSENNNQCNRSSTPSSTNQSSDSDYINANYIKLVDESTTISPRTKPTPNSKIYIATQGPLPNTVNDFWFMVWQERSDCIVMVTREIERNKNMCYRYWPTIEQPTLKCGPIEIKILSEEPKKAHGDDYVRRKFELRYSGSDENNDCRDSRRVIQYQYFSWPDQRTPSNPDSILSFLHEINRNPTPRSPLIVHCSAGIGRSGALIVIDMLIDQLKYYRLTYEIDIQRIVKVVRSQRSGLVQTEAQYKFIYLAIQRYIASVKQPRYDRGDGGSVQFDSHKTNEL